ncbi:MAG: hypothetical protein HY673_25355 [Chloroflexi bacterium]|nr:hypothetical protein [Chloroflexota bacterium]
MKTQRSPKCREPEHALAVAVYRNEQERLKYLLQKALGKYGKPKISLKQLRARLGAQMGDISLSQEIIKMREEGY